MVAMSVLLGHVQPGDVVVSGLFAGEFTGEFTVASVHPAKARGYVVLFGLHDFRTSGHRTMRVQVLRPVRSGHLRESYR
jgi:hypothetical protein